VLSVGAASPAVAQDSLPDPNKPDSSKSTKTAENKTPAAGKTSDLPTTGIETSWLVLAGVALMGAGVAVRPAARLRRSYRTDTWENLVRSGS
jgi:LPXTG-motif cell wall-anchored protein